MSRRERLIFFFTFASNKNEDELKDEKRILGIDPGTTIMGFGVLRGISKPELIDAGILDFRKHKGHYLKLKAVYESASKLFDKYKPDELAIEAPFFGKNVQSMLKLGRCQGIIMALALSRSIPVFEYSPRKVKLAITGNGSASKEQLSIMVQQIFQVKTVFEKYDASDAAAVALCHFYAMKSIVSTSKSNNWKDFLEKNQNRIYKTPSR